VVAIDGMPIARVPVPVSFIERLTRETERYHADADHELDAFIAGDATAARYREYLIHQHGFLAPVERALEACPGLDGVVDVRPRAKAPLLRSDLIGLGIVGDLPRYSTPVLDTISAALGWLYVIERQTLWHLIVLRGLARTLPKHVTLASSFLRCYEGCVDEMWGELLATLACAANVYSADDIIAAARVAFRAQRMWQRQHQRVA
jgi:heme oxygenase